MNNSLFKFSLGQVVATPDALRAIEEAQEVSSTFLIRHQKGDWGLCVPEDQYANEHALRDGSRLLSIYRLKTGVRIWIMTEAVGDDGKRASTCIMLPENY